MRSSIRKIENALFVGVLLVAGLGCTPASPPIPEVEDFGLRIQALEAAHEANPSDETALHQLAMGNWWLASDVESAQAYYEQLLALNPDHFQAHYEMGQVLDLRGRYSKSVHHLRRFLELYAADSKPGEYAERTIARFEDVASSETVEGSWKVDGDTAKNSLDMEFIRIPAGEFAMGSADAPPDSETEHTVALDAYWIGKYEVTAGQYKAFLDDTGYRTLFPPINDYARTADHAAVFVSWSGAEQFTMWLSSRENRVYRLPSEAEWEFAARGTDGRTNPWGNELAKAEVHGNLGRILRAVSLGKKPTVEKVGQYDAGRSFFGLHDMAGNTEEWCLDYYDAAFYLRSPAKNPFGPANPASLQRVLRGASWRIKPTRLHAVTRGKSDSEINYDNFGFRIVCEIEKPPED